MNIDLFYITIFIITSLLLTMDLSRRTGPCDLRLYMYTPFCVCLRVRVRHVFMMFHMKRQLYRTEHRSLVLFAVPSNSFQMNETHEWKMVILSGGRARAHSFAVSIILFSRPWCVLSGELYVR